MSAVSALLALSRPSSPPLGDKLADLETLAHLGGNAFIDGRDVLELGPARGVDALLLADRARSWTSVDMDPAVIAHVQRVAPDVRAMAVDLSQPWPFADGSFDLVIDFSTLDDVFAADGSGAALLGYAEASRVLREGGHLVGTYANRRAIAPELGLQTQDPAELAAFLATVGLGPIYETRHDFARAAIACVKGPPGSRWYPHPNPTKRRFIRIDETT